MLRGVLWRRYGKKKFSKRQEKFYNGVKQEGVKMLISVLTVKGSVETKGCRVMNLQDRNGNEREEKEI